MDSIIAYNGQTITSNYVYVLDTSFLIDHFLRMLWTLRLRDSLWHENSRIVFPAGVSEEFARILHQLKNTSSDLSYIGSELGDFFERKKPVETREINIQEIFFPLEERTAGSRPFRPRGLSYTDKGLVTAALVYAREGNPVYLATSDHSIVETLGEIRDRENLEIKVMSPWNKLTKDDFSSLDVKVLITDSVFEDLLRVSPSDNCQRYLAVATGMHIGNGVEIDIAFGIYTKKAIYKPLPHIDGVFFIPIAIIDFEKDRQKYARYYLSFLAFAKYAVFYETQLSNIGIVEQKPLTPDTLKQIGKFKHEQFIVSEDLQTFRRRLESLLDRRYIEWARVKEWHLKDESKLTQGKLNALRQELRKRE